MGIIKNYSLLATSPKRKVVLDLIEVGLASLQVERVMTQDFVYQGHILKIQGKEYDLENFDRIHLIAFGKGAGAIAKTIESTLEDKLTDGFAIDVSEALFNKVEFTLGTHPLPSSQNLEFTNKVIEKYKDLSERDLVLVVICGGGSVMFDSPYSISLDKLIEVNKALLASGADIIEMNKIRKHLSKTKGGGLINALSPAKVVSLIFSDVPGNDLSFIASGPTVKDETTKEEALNVYQKYNLQGLNLTDYDFIETPKDDVIFSKVDNILMLSNLTALNAMKNKAQEIGITANIFSDKFQSDAALAAKTLIDNTKEGEILLAGGETTIKVKNPEGKGGRNQVLVLASLDTLPENVTISSFDSDGWDNTPAAGAIGDRDLLKSSIEKGINHKEYLEKDNSFTFFESVGGSIITDRLPTNMSDLMIVYKS